MEAPLPTGVLPLLTLITLIALPFRGVPLKEQTWKRPRLVIMPMPFLRLLFLMKLVVPKESLRLPVTAITTLSRP